MVQDLGYIVVRVGSVGPGVHWWERAMCMVKDRVHSGVSGMFKTLSTLVG